MRTSYPRVMATDLPQPVATADHPQRVCPHCATVSRTAGALCPHCRRSLHRRPGTAAIVLSVVLSALATIGAVTALLAATADDVDREISSEIDVVQRDIEREVARAQREIEAEVARLRNELAARPTIP